MNSKVFRGVPRIFALTLTFLVGAGFFAFAAVLAKDSKGLAVVLWILAAVSLLLALRTPFTRAVATAEGLKVHGPIGNSTYRWSDIATVSAAKTEQDGALIDVRAPVLHLTSGKKVPVRPASTYRTASAARVAGELEQLRQAYSR